VIKSSLVSCVLSFRVWTSIYLTAYLTYSQGFYVPMLGKPIERTKQIKSDGQKGRKSSK